MSTFVLHCDDCGHVGGRVFTVAKDGLLRDVLAGARGVTPDCCRCSVCGSASLSLTEEAA